MRTPTTVTGGAAWHPPLPPPTPLWYNSAMTTPMRQQYLDLKRQYKDTILLFRLGDFYETFDDDAKTVASVCDVVLTSRPVGNDQRVPLAGVPWHSVEGYIARLVQAGYKVAIAEQDGTTPIGGLVPRLVNRVISAGTVVEPGMLPDRRNNYLVALARDGERAGVAYADISTGEFATTELSGADVALRVREELARIQPAELLLADTAHADHPAGDDHPGRVYALTTLPAWQFELDHTRRVLLDHFDVRSLDGFGCEGKPLAVRAAGALLGYLRDMQPGALAQLTSLHTYSTGDFMVLDEATRRNLELTEAIRGTDTRGTLLAVLDDTRTPMGARLLRRWLGQPLLDVDQLTARLDSVALFFGDTLARTAVMSQLRGFGDLERWTNRVVQRIALPRDLLGIMEALATVGDLRQLLAPLAAQVASVATLYDQLDTCDDLRQLIVAAIADQPPATLQNVGIIRPGYSAEVDSIIATSRDAKAWIANLENSERTRTGIRSLKVGYNKVFGYYLEVSDANAHLVPADYIRKQTLVKAERYITPQLKEVENLILHADERQLELEQQIYREVLDQLAAGAARLLGVAHAVAELDVYTSLAEVAVRHRYVRPELADDGVIHIVDGRHPVVELMQRAEPFVPNDTLLTPDEAIHLVTGPNMSGKSTALRQVALITLMAQIGSFVPASQAHIGLVDRVFTRVGAADDIARGQSTFMVEMVEAANILNHATQRSLLILDEIGRGTSTYDGLAIAWAIVEYIHNHPRLRSKTLFATHYHELTDLAERLPHVVNYNVSVAEEGDRVVFLRRIVRGKTDRSYGIHVAQLAGLPRAVIARAQEILTELESQGTATPLRPTAVSGPQQLSLFSLTHPLVAELKQLDINALTPLAALNVLYELQQRAAQEG